MCAWFSHASFALAKGAPPHFCVALGAVGLPGLVWCVVCDPAACHVASVTRAERLEQMLARACSNSFRKSFLGLGFGVPFGVAGCRGVREGLWGPHDCIYMFVGCGATRLLSTTSRSCKYARGVDRSDCVCVRCAGRWCALVARRHPAFHRLPHAQAGRGWRMRLGRLLRRGASTCLLLRSLRLVLIIFCFL